MITRHPIHNFLPKPHGLPPERVAALQAIYDALLITFPKSSLMASMIYLARLGISRCQCDFMWANRKLLDPCEEEFSKNLQQLDIWAESDGLERHTYTSEVMKLVYKTPHHYLRVGEKPPAHW